MPTPAHIEALIEKYLQGTASPEEVAELNNWYRSFDDSEAEIPLASAADLAGLEARLQQRILQTTGHHTTSNRKRSRPWVAAAAAVLLMGLMGTAYYLFFAQQQPVVSPAVAVQPKPAPVQIVPGGNKAILTLADGSTIVLDSASNGVLSQQGNIAVEKLDNGLLAYHINGKIITENDEAFYNTISTPKGGQYQVTLSDGTKVWLNAASSIRFPVVFTGAMREVTITGETYFEVTKNEHQPFIVQAGNSRVEVLGTHFNINAYDDEASVKTTLLEGKVKVSVAGQTAEQASRYLSPGQQSNVGKNGQLRIVDNADTEEAVAWKNGRFQFKSADLKTILRQMARWYKVEVEYRGNVDLHFTGQLTRNEEVERVFQLLELTGEVHFRTEGRKIIVTR